MTELKIKQADINNNGNQRLTGNSTGGGVNLKICIVYGGGCAHATNYLACGGWGWGVTVHLKPFFSSMSCI